MDIQMVLDLCNNVQILMILIGKHEYMNEIFLIEVWYEIENIHILLMMIYMIKVIFRKDSLFDENHLLV